LALGGVYVTEEVDSKLAAGQDVLQIGSAAERASQLTRGLLAFSRRAHVHPTPLDLRAVAGESAGLLRRLVGEHIAFWFDIEDDVPCVLPDRVQIDQVLLNLAANARDAMPAGGQLRIRVMAFKLKRRSTSLTRFLAPDVT